MVSEIILCVKERNKQTRATSFELLVQIAHAMHDAEPPPPGLDYAMAAAVAASAAAHIWHLVFAHLAIKRHSLYKTAIKSLKLLLLLLPLAFCLVPPGRPLPGRHHNFVQTLLGPLALLLPPVHQPLVQGPVGIWLHLGGALGVAPCTRQPGALDVRCCRVAQNGNQGSELLNPAVPRQGQLQQS